MNWTWPIPLDEIWSSAAFPMWLTLAAAGFFGLIVLITLLRAEKSVANGALTVITLLAVGIAVASTMRNLDGASQSAAAGARAVTSMTVSMPALACVDDLAGDLVLSNCEKTLFGSADSTAAAVSYAASVITRLAAAGDVATANKAMTPELSAQRRAVERDRYGLMAYVLLTRDRCTPSDCAAFRLVTDSQQLVNNMEGRTYEGLVTRYASQWNAPPTQAPQPVGGGLAGLVPPVPTGKPTNAEFPSAASTPPVSIMTPEPTASTSRAAAPPAAPAPAVAPPRTPSPAVAASHAQAPAKKSAPPKPKPPATAAPQAAPEPAEPPAAE
jgi:hypothetical protein